MAEGVSIREFARLDGCNDKLVRRAIEGGFLSAFSDGSLDPALVGTPWRKSNRERADLARTPGADSADIGADLSAPPDDGDVGSLAYSQRVKEHYLAQQRRLEYERQAGLLVPIADVAATVGGDYARVRTRLLALPAEHAPRLHRLKSPAEIQDLLMSLMVEVLEELSGDDAGSGGD